MNRTVKQHNTDAPIANVRGRAALYGIFDAAYYLQNNPDVTGVHIDPLGHYLQTGWAEGRNPNPLFNSDYYLDSNPDIFGIGINPLIHYVDNGAREGRNPSLLFHSAWYRETYALDGDVNPLAHYIHVGIRERLNPAPLFDAEWYVRTYPDAAGNPLAHYVERASGRRTQPHPLFDPEYYLSQNPDVAEARIDPLAHYLSRGHLEPRRPHPDFDAVWYLAKYPDVARAKMNPLIHYVLVGRKEGREAKPRVATPPAPERIPVPIIDEVMAPSLAKGPVFRHEWESKSRVLAMLKESKNLTEVPRRVCDAAQEIVTRSPLKVSVVIPTWNREATVCGAVRSALMQEYPPHEIIVADDGSTDNTVATIRTTFSAAIAAGTVRIVECPHRGVSAARNAALRIAEGDVITYLDSDNEWRPEYTLIMAAVFGECDEVCTAYAALKSHNKTTGEVRFRATEYDRRRLLSGNFIDLNVFAHRRRLHAQLGGFDETLSRLVDWDLIVRYTKLYPPAYAQFCGVDYYLDRVNLNNITFSESLDVNYAAVAGKNLQERIRFGIDHLRLAYFIYDFPALSQTFVLNEVRWLVQKGFDVEVFYAAEPDCAATLDFKVKTTRVHSAAELADKLVETRRTVCHAHFVWPGVTNFVAPACKRAGIRYTFMPHAVDLFHVNNRERSRVGELANDANCLKVFVYGDHHRRFLESRGVRRDKIAYNFQAIIPADFETPGRASSTTLRGIAIGRFIEKKGFGDLVEAARLLGDTDVEFRIYGYGPLSESIQARIDALGVKNVTLAGVLQGKEAVSAAIADSDFLVAPCVEASNGDVDGFPTVLLEAIAARKPIVTTAVSAIPDYLRDGVEAVMVSPNDPGSLADGIRRLCSMSPGERSAMVENAATLLREKAGVGTTMRRCLDVWCGYEVDVWMVTHNVPAYEDRNETKEIIRRILTRTTTPFTLTIVDNQSSSDFLEDIRSIIAGHGNVRLIENRTNIFCGPASNLALSYGCAEFGIYLCSKEAFIRRHGWERPLIERMRADERAVIGGCTVHIPRYTTGAELLSHQEFHKFRNPNFARHNAESSFSHIQGGVFILRRDALRKYGWFSTRLPQNLMDVEYSYFLMSRGARLVQFPEVRSLTIKTLPKLGAVLDESTVVAHPLSLKSPAAWLDGNEGVVTTWTCNICGTASQRHDMATCVACASTPFGRTAAVAVAHDHRTHRGQVCAVAAHDPGLRKFLGDRLFRVVPLASRSPRGASVYIVDLDRLPGGDTLSEMVNQLTEGACLVAGGQEVDGLRSAVFGAHFEVAWLRPSRYLNLDWRPMVKIERLRSPGAGSL